MPLADISHFHGHLIDWGNVPAWFGGGSLILALYLLLRDAKRNERDQASKVAIVGQVSDTPVMLEGRPRYTYSVELTNTSDLQVIRPFAIGRTMSRREFKQYEGSRWTGGTLLPHKFHMQIPFCGDLASTGVRAHSVAPSKTVALTYALDYRSDYFHCHVVFADASGRNWDRCLSSGSLYRWNLFSPMWAIVPRRFAPPRWVHSLLCRSCRMIPNWL